MLRRLVAVLFHALLQWGLMSLLLMNGFFFYVIAKFASFFGLGPPCILCAHVDRLFFETGQHKHTFHDLFCDAHVTEIAKSGDQGPGEMPATAGDVPLEAEQQEEAKGESSACCHLDRDDILEIMARQPRMPLCEPRQVPMELSDAMTSMRVPISSQFEAQEAQEEGSVGNVLLVEAKMVVNSATKRNAVLEESSLEKPQGMEAHRVISIGSEICEQDHVDETQLDESNAETINNSNKDDPYVSLFELAPLVALPLEYPGDFQEQDRTSILEKTELEGESYGSLSVEIESGERLTIGRLIATLRAERKELRVLRAELEDEKHAKMEALEYQKQLEEQCEFDREAVQIAMQLIHETEKEKHDLQKQLEAYKVKVQLYEAEERRRVATHSAIERSTTYYSKGIDDLSSKSTETSADIDIKSPRGDQGTCKTAAALEELPIHLEEESNKGEVAEHASEDNHREMNEDYQSLVDFLPGSMYSSSPDLANLLKLYTEGRAGIHQRNAHQFDEQLSMDKSAEANYFSKSDFTLAEEREVLTSSKGTSDTFERIQATGRDDIDCLEKEVQVPDLVRSTFR